MAKRAREILGSVNFHITGPSNSCMAQHSCIGQQTFVNLRGNLKSLRKSANSYIFGDRKPSPSIGKTKIEFLVHEFNIDVISQDVPRLIGMDILDSKDQDRSIFHLISQKDSRQWMVSRLNCWGTGKVISVFLTIFIKISPKYRQNV